MPSWHNVRDSILGFNIFIACIVQWFVGLCICALSWKVSLYFLVSNVDTSSIKWAIFWHFYCLTDFVDLFVILFVYSLNLLQWKNTHNTYCLFLTILLLNKPPLHKVTVGSLIDILFQPFYFDPKEATTVILHYLNAPKGHVFGAVGLFWILKYLVWHLISKTISFSFWLKNF